MRATLHIVFNPKPLSTQVSLVWKKLRSQAMDGPLSVPQKESLDNNMAIRQFCVARQEHEEQQEHWEDTPNGVEMWSQWDTTSSPRLGALEQDDFADSFINTDIYGEDGGVTAGQTHQAPDEHEMSVTPNTIFYGEVQMTDGEELELGSPVEESDMGVMVLSRVSEAPSDMRRENGRLKRNYSY